MSVGTFDIIEQLDGYTAESDGSFEMKFSLQNGTLCLQACPLVSNY